MSDLAGLTKFFSTDPDELIALKQRVMNDRLPLYKGDAIYCVGGTTDTQDASTKIAAHLWAFRYAEIIGVLRGTTTHGYCGFEFCRNLLMGYGVCESAIVPIDILPEDGDTLNTYTEGKALVSHARSVKWRKIIVCAPYFHQIRASSTFISLLDKENPELWIFNKPGLDGDMQERVVHSQGVVDGDMLELFISEFGRLFRYHQIGHILSCAELLAYYDLRDVCLATL